MRKLSAQYIFTNAGPVLKRGIIHTDDDGTIIKIEDTRGALRESQSVEFYNGIIIPGFVNCHCHLELSWRKNTIPGESGLAEFIRHIRIPGEMPLEKKLLSIAAADKEMASGGVVLCADICNTPDSFEIKKESRIKYLNLLEVFGIDPLRSEQRIGQILDVAEKARSAGLAYQVVPHSAYSVSLPLFRTIKQMATANRVTSFHFLESGAEKTFLENHSGPIADSYTASGLLNGEPDTARSHTDVVLNEITGSGNLILVHNTFADRDIIRKVKKRDNIFWCLCPNSNLYIEKRLPPVDLLVEERCTIVTGTDSLASNNSLSILDEIKTLNRNFNAFSLQELVKWATINGARALGEEEMYGSIEPGKKPGLLLLRDADLHNMRLLPDSTVQRLI